MSFTVLNDDVNTLDKNIINTIKKNRNLYQILVRRLVQK